MSITGFTTLKYERNVKTNEKRLIPICLRRKKNGKKVYG